jgi:hypothetical protein
MKTIFTILAGSVIILTGCTMTPVALQSVGPAPMTDDNNGGTGQLRVFTATESHEIGDNTFFHPHTGYRICTSDGKFLKYVPNHQNYTDEMATVVRLPVGNYMVYAQCESYNLVSVPVVILAGKTTVVHLETTWQPPSTATTDQLVYLPNGRPVGWRSYPSHESPN